MKNTVLIAIIFLGLGLINAHAQNLVPNYSFEDTVASPTTTAEIGNSLFWISPSNGTPDYYNSSANLPMASSIPLNSFGFQYAKSLNAYAGINCAGQFTSGGPLEGREYVQAELIDSLLAGNSYAVEFYVSLANYSTVAITELGAFLSSTQITLPSMLNFPFTPQIVSPSGYFLEDTLNWYKVSGIFVAGGGEKYITIGNFNDAANTDTMNRPVTAIGGTFSYYYVDDVSVTNVTGMDETNNDAWFTLFPNPAHDKITIETHQAKGYVRLYDITGIFIRQVVVNPKRTEIDIQDLANGIYFLQMGNATKKLVIQH